MMCRGQNMELNFNCSKQIVLLKFVLNEYCERRVFTTAGSAEEPIVDLRVLFYLLRT